MDRSGSPVANSVDLRSDGIRLKWHWWNAERKYTGRFIAWKDIQDADLSAAPPQLRLPDGRIVFIAAAHLDGLTVALIDAGVRLEQRPDVWGHLLEPFLDTDHEIMRVRVEQDLRSWGFGDDEVSEIRDRLRPSMMKFTAQTWEWRYYGRTDAIANRRAGNSGRDQARIIS